MEEEAEWRDRKISHGGEEENIKIVRHCSALPTSSLDLPTETSCTDNFHGRERPFATSQQIVEWPMERSSPLQEDRSEWTSDRSTILTLAQKFQPKQRYPF
ncbi:hypothetical protein MPC4_410003 [Methylocella tundrae]|uniref:Uncharacterized protein n=1 Tax=Methylocella tundrae TaxID=227605 RepID=A0A8B6MC98_METTU|nr:hypothetical protein MPC4_410003 [Methylocella tundrae]